MGACLETMRPPIAVFRCDASPSIGAGHATRCFALADALAELGWQTWFAVAPESLAAAPTLARHRCLIVEGDVTTENTRIAAAIGHRVDWLVIDHNGRYAEFETACRQWAGRILVITDLPDRKHDCDLLVDQTIGRTAKEYVPLVPSHCRVLGGTDYALVRRQFTEERAAAERRRTTPQSVRRLLLLFGATDVFRLTGRVLAALLRSSPNVTIDVVSGTLPTEDLVKLSAASDCVILHTAVEDMAKLMLATDLAVGLAGTSAWERCTLGLPSALFIPSESFREITDRLATAGAVSLIGDREFDDHDASAAILALAADGDRLAQMSAAAFRVCDGLGARRVASAIQTFENAD
jgi:UDP-2,4-diacetamido-2,4,6-trideoxy-beta-L-altropyranose hydrolase